MRTTSTRIATAVAAMLTIATPAFAASSYVDNGSILVVSFLGCCALVIALIPDERNPRCAEMAEPIPVKAEDREE